MKKATLQYLVDLMNYRINQNGGEAETDTVYVAVRDELTAELNRGAEKAQANRDLYAEAHDIIMEALPTETPVTITELYDEIADRLPDGFSKGKVQYAITRMWTDEIFKHVGKTNSYTRKV